MGLDMYLYRKHYVKQWDHIPAEDQYNVTVKKGNKTVTHIKKDRICYITEEVGYWRKFNALHQWFVENCQEGVDDCRESYVPYESIKEVLDILKKIKDNHSLSEELLPSASGFFFGSTEYDDWYFQNVEETIPLLEEILKEDTGEIYYKSSW